jgi:hypothetical protein
LVLLWPVPTKGLHGQHCETTPLPCVAAIDVRPNWREQPPGEDWRWAMAQCGVALKTHIGRRVRDRLCRRVCNAGQYTLAITVSPCHAGVSTSLPFHEIRRVPKAAAYPAHGESDDLPIVLSNLRPVEIILQAKRLEIWAPQGGYRPKAVTLSQVVDTASG